MCFWQVQHFAQKAASYVQLKRYASRKSTPDNSISYAEEVSSELQPGLEVLNDFNTRMLQNTYVLWAWTYDLSWAFHVFKSMNETGLELTDTDKLKALVVACWSMESKAQESHADEWDQCIVDVGGGKNFQHVLHMMAYANGMPYTTGLLHYMVRLVLLPCHPLSGKGLRPVVLTCMCTAAHMRAIIYCVLNCRSMTTLLVAESLFCLKTNQTMPGSSWSTWQQRANTIKQSLNRSLRCFQQCCVGLQLPFHRSRNCLACSAPLH